MGGSGQRLGGSQAGQRLGRVGRALHDVGRRLSRGYKASGVAGEPWRTCLGRRMRSGAVAAAGRVGRGRGWQGRAKQVGSGRAAGNGGGDVPERWERRDCVRKVANDSE